MDYANFEINAASLRFLKIDKKLFEQTEILQQIVSNLLESIFGYKWNMTLNEKKNLSNTYLQNLISKYRIQEQKDLIIKLDIEKWDIPILHDMCMEIGQKHLTYQQMISIVNLKEIRNKIKHKAKAELEKIEGEEIEEQIKEIEEVLNKAIQQKQQNKQNDNSQKILNSNQKSKHKSQNQKQKQIQQLEKQMIDLSQNRQKKKQENEQKTQELKKQILITEREINILQKQSQQIKTNLDDQKNIIKTKQRQQQEIIQFDPEKFFQQKKVEIQKITSDLDQRVQQEKQQNDSLQQEYQSVQKQLKISQQILSSQIKKNEEIQNKLSDQQALIKKQETQKEDLHSKKQQILVTNEMIDQMKQNFIEPKVNLYTLADNCYLNYQKDKEKNVQFLQESIYIAEEALKFDQNQKELMFLLTNSYTCNKEYDKAIKYCRLVQKLYPNEQQIRIQQKIKELEALKQQEGKFCIIF